MPLDLPNSHFESPETRARKAGFEAAVAAFERAADDLLKIGIDAAAVNFRNGVHQLAAEIRKQND